LFLKPVCFGECTGITFVDFTKIAVCNNKRISRNKVFGGMAERGKNSTAGFTDSNYIWFAMTKESC
jgi:hypothetical protein